MSFVPKYKFFILACIKAPKHIIQGSTVTYIEQPINL